MEKNFTQWHTLKGQIEQSSADNTPSDGDIWWYYEGVNVGEELSKDTFLRPCIILKKKCGRNLCMIAPLTSQTPTGWFLPYALHMRTWEKYGLKKPSWILFNQARHIDYRRLHKKISNDGITRWFLKKIWYAFAQKYTPENRGRFGLRGPARVIQLDSSIQEFLSNATFLRQKNYS